VPAVADTLLLIVKGLFQFQRVMGYQALDGAMINIDATFLHHLFNIAVAQCIGHILAHTQKNDFLLVMATFEADHG